MHGSGQSTPDRRLTVGEAIRRTESSLAADHAEAAATGAWSLGDDRWVIVESRRPYSSGWDEIARHISEALEDDSIEVIIWFADGTEHSRRRGQVYTGPRRR